MINLPRVITSSLFLICVAACTDDHQPASFDVSGVEIGMTVEQAEAALMPVFGQDLERMLGNYPISYYDFLKGSEHLGLLSFGGLGDSSGRIIIDRKPGTEEVIGVLWTQIFRGADPLSERSLGDVTQMFVERYGEPMRTVLKSEQGREKFDVLHLWVNAEVPERCKGLKNEAKALCREEALEFCSNITDMGRGGYSDPYSYTVYANSDGVPRPHHREADEHYLALQPCGEMFVVTLNANPRSENDRIEVIQQMLIHPSKWLASQEAFLAHWYQLAEEAGAASD